MPLFCWRLGEAAKLISNDISTSPAAGGRGGHRTYLPTGTMDGGQVVEPQATAGDSSNPEIGHWLDSGQTVYLSPYLEAYNCLSLIG